MVGVGVEACNWTAVLPLHVSVYAGVAEDVSTRGESSRVGPHSLAYRAA